MPPSTENTTLDLQSDHLAAATSDDHPMAKRLGSRDEARRLWAYIGFKLGHRYRDSALETICEYDPKQRPAMETIRDFAKNLPRHIGDGGGLILYGKPGTGKDHIVSALLRIAVLDYGFSAMFRDGMALYAETRKAIGANGEEELRKELCSSQILVISDPIPPVGELTDYQTAFIRDIIDRRYRRCLSTWITTNMETRAGLIASLTLPVFERLREGATVVYFDWESYRTRHPAKMGAEA